MMAKSLPMGQMYRVLRGLPGTMLLTTPSGEKYTLTVVNRNAPKNRCQETMGLCISLDGPMSSSERTTTTRKLTAPELRKLRAGNPLPLTFGDVVVTLQSNPGGQLVRLGP